MPLKFKNYNLESKVEGLIGRILISVLTKTVHPKKRVLHLQYNER